MLNARTAADADPTINVAALRGQSSSGPQQRQLPFDSTHFVVHNFQRTSTNLDDGFDFDVEWNGMDRAQKSR